jgi:hypothetical protein
MAWSGCQFRITGLLARLRAPGKCFRLTLSERLLGPLVIDSGKVRPWLAPEVLSTAELL